MIQNKRIKCWKRPKTSKGTKMRFYNYLLENDKKLSKEELDKLESWADALFAKVDIDVEFTKHFLQRVNDVRNKRQITFAELKDLFQDTYRRYGKKIPTLGDDAQAVIQDMRSDINVPFVLNWDIKSQEFDLISKTIMRKSNFKTTNPKFVVGI